MVKKACAILVIGMLALSGCAARRVGSSSASGSFDTHFKEGVSYLGQGDYGRAAEQLRAAVAINPGSAKAHNYLGLCYFQRKDYDAAEAEFEKAVALDQSFASAYNNLAGAHSIKLQFAEAKEMYKKALALSPDMVSANYSLGMLLSNLGEREEGARYLARAIALDPDYLDKHKEFVSACTSISFDMREAYFTYAKAFAAAGNVDKAADYLEKAREAGFSDWRRVLLDKEFERVRDDPKIKKFLVGVTKSL
jgi:tetratricopeptide (TPR) repeat protein